MRSRLLLLGLPFGVALLLFVFLRGSGGRETPDSQLSRLSGIDASRPAESEHSNLAPDELLATPKHAANRLPLQAEEPERSSKAGNNDLKAWSLTVRDGHTRQLITSGIELRFRDQAGEEQIQLVHSAADLKQLSADLRDRKISLVVNGYRPEEFRWRGKISFKVVTLVRERELTIHFVDSGDSGRAYASSIQFAKRVISTGLAKAGAEPIHRQLEIENAVTVMLTPQMRRGEPSPVYERELALLPIGDTVIEIDFAEIASFSVVDLRLRLDLLDPGFLADNVRTRFYSSLPDGQALSGLTKRGWKLKGWGKTETREVRELFIENVPTGTYTLSIAELGFARTFQIWPRGGEHTEHTERIALPPLGRVTAVAVGIPDAEGKGLDPVERDALFWGYLSDEGSQKFLERAKRGHLSRDELARTYRGGLIRRAEPVGVGRWNLTCIAGRDVWVIYSGYRQRFAEPLLWSPASGRTEVRLEVVRRR